MLCARTGALPSIYNSYCVWLLQLRHREAWIRAALYQVHSGTITFPSLSHFYTFKSANKFLQQVNNPPTYIFAAEFGTLWCVALLPGNEELHPQKAAQEEVCQVEDKLKSEVRLSIVYERILYFEGCL